MIAFNWCFPKNSITSFEPQKKEYSFLEFNRLCNTIPGRSINSLVVSEPGNYNLFIDNLTGGRSTCIDMTNTLSKDKVTYDSEISLLSDFISEKTKLIKVDIEGYEKELFKTYHSFYDHIYFIIEVRSSSSKHILSTFLKTHKVYFVERNAFLEKVDEIISETLF